MSGPAPKYKTPEDMQVVIDRYFDECAGHPLVVDGEVVLDKYGNPIYVDKRPVTMTGLARALGYTTRKTIMDYKNKSKGFERVIAAARLRVEQYTEERLYDREGWNGARFSLAVNFGWQEDKSSNVTDGAKEVVIVELTRKNADAQTTSSAD